MFFVTLFLVTANATVPPCSALYAAAWAALVNVLVVLVIMIELYGFLGWFRVKV